MISVSYTESVCSTRNSLMLTRLSTDNDGISDVNIHCKNHEME